MYNLLVSANHQAWQTNRDEYSRDRIASAREYTVPEIAERYKSLDSSAIAELCSFPSLFAYERGNEPDARLGSITEIRLKSGRVGFAFGLHPNVPGIPGESIQRLRWELDIDEWEMNRSHWAVKDVDLYPSLVDAGVLDASHVASLPQVATPARGRSDLLVSPEVFNIPAGLPQERDLVSVMMPFDASFRRVYDYIHAACQDVGLRCLRADDIWEHSTVIQDVFNLLVRSRFVIADFSTQNANVMYETGIAHTLGRPLVPMAQSLDAVPFDLRHHRVLKYLPNEEGLADLRTRLADRLRTLAA